MPLNTASKVH